MSEDVDMQKDTPYRCPFCGNPWDIGSDEDSTQWVDCSQCEYTIEALPHETNNQFFDRVAQPSRQKQAAYERGKAEGREAVRGRIREALEARKTSAIISEARALKQNNLDWGRAMKYQQDAFAFEEAINIVNQE